MAERVYIGIDLGAESGRVVAGIFDGERMHLEELRRFANIPVEIFGTLRWYLPLLWNEIQHGLSAAAKFGNAIASIGVDSWAVDYVLLSKSGELLDQPYHYRDKRTAGVMERVFQTVQRETIFERTGVQFLPFNTIYQLVASRERMPDLFDRADRLLMIPDYLNWLLCGALTNEYTNATTTQLFSPSREDWDWDLIDKLDLPDRLFGDMVAPGTHIGVLRPDLQSKLGLGPISIVAPATHDTASAVAAVPTMQTGKSNWAYISSGTWSLVGLEAPSANLSPMCLECNLTNEGGIAGTYRLLKNVMGLWLVQECRKSLARVGQDCSYDQLMVLAERAEPRRSVIDPDDARLLNPTDMAAAIADCCLSQNQPEPKGPGQLIRCCVDSLAAKYASVLKQLEEVQGIRVETVHIVGGGSQNRLLNQLASDATGRPVIAGPVEATVLGNVLVQAMAAGHVRDLAGIREIVRSSFAIQLYEPDATNR